MGLSVISISIGQYTVTIPANKDQSQINQNLQTELPQRSHTNNMLFVVNLQINNTSYFSSNRA